MRPALLAPLLFLSGSAALVLEVAWFRRMAQVSGATALALGAVLAAVIGGMALGALLFGRRADRCRHPVRLYALLEIGVAVSALVSPWLLDLVGAAHVGVHRLLGASTVLETGASFLICVLLLAVPAVLMGGTLPAAAAGLRTRPERRGHDVGWLYAVNTLGGVAGTLAAGFVLLPELGLAGTMRLAAVLSGAAALGGFFLGRASRCDAPAPDGRRFARLTERRAIALYAVSGFLGLACEVTFTRALVLVFGSTTYAFSTVLAVFLLGIGAGGLVGSRLARKGDALRRLEVTVSITAVCFALSALLVYFLPRLYLEGYIRLGSDFETGLLIRFLLAAAVLLPGTIGLGIAFPLGAHIAAEAGLGRGTGRLYAANAIASIAGSTLAVFVLVPVFGPQYATTVVALFAVVVVLFLTRRWIVLVPLALVALAFIPPPAVARERLLAGVYYDPGVWLEDGRINETWWREGVDIPFTAHGREATVCITRWYGRASLLINGKAVASEHLATDVQHLALLGHLPMAVHPAPRSILVVGLGMGTTWRAVAMHDPPALAVVEIEAAVAEAAARLGVRPKRLIVGDARTHLRATDERYDVITSDPIHPWVRGGGDLYTREYYTFCRDQLAPGGVACQWVPLYQIGLDDVRNVIRTFADVFRIAVYFTGADLVLIGTVGGDPPPARVPGGQAGEALSMLSVPDLGVLFVAGHDAVLEAVADATVLEDDALGLEFSTPRHVESPEMGACLRWVRDLWGVPPEPYGALLDAQEAQVAGDEVGLGDVLVRSLARSPGNGFVRRFAGEIYLQSVDTAARAGNVESAKCFLAWARRYLGSDPRLIGAEADLWMAVGEKERAAVLLQQLLDRYPDSLYLQRRIRFLRDP